MSSAAPQIARRRSALLIPGSGGNNWVAVHKEAGPEAAAWAGQEAAVELEDMT